ncbi:uncharacterized protein LOC128204594 [Mya arenaria]|uniref:uncharacterized protein LOC128204594 n=1 Tax=Mya arenaria TaxID=6604 RepID=UPI0022E2D891|nr:uncharacterized protein LOC128204594 [Mya arenaria]
MCDINGICTNGCIANTFGKQCENTCDEYCTQNGNKTICSEKTGMFFTAAKPNTRGDFVLKLLKQKRKTKLFNSSTWCWYCRRSLVLAAIVVVGLFLIRRRRVNLRIESKAHEKEPEIFLEMYAKVNNGSTTREENPKRDTDNFHSVTVIRPPNYQSPPTNRFGNEKTPILTEDNLEIDEDDASARESAIIFEENGGFYFNNAEEISKIKLNVTDLPEYVHNLCFKDLEEEFQKIPYGLVKAYGVSQTNLTCTKIGPMTKQLGDFGQFWRMVWQQKVEKIVMVTNLVEGKNSKKRSLHHLQFTSWPDKGVPDDVTSFIEFRQRVNALASTFDGPFWRRKNGNLHSSRHSYKEGEAEGAIDILGCVLNMRQNDPT